MGNYISCTLTTSLVLHSNFPKVIFPGGEVRQLNRSATAAELMFETPNHFLVNSRSMEIGRRFSPLAADEDLEGGNVYVMFPMKRVGAVVTAADMGRLLMAANSAIRRASGGRRRVLPEFGQTAEAVAGGRSEETEMRVKVDENVGRFVGEFRQRMSLCRSKRPTLETIAEETFSSSRS